MKVIDGIVNWGIIGCGDVCEVKSGPAFNKVPDSRLVAVMRRDEAKAADYAKRHHVPRYYSDASKLINDPEVNAIYIATPPSSHGIYMTQALKAGKPVYVEKPVSINSEVCQQMIDVKNQLDGFVTVAHYRRELPLFKKVRELIEDNEIGRITLVRLSTLQAKADKNGWRVDPELSGGGLFHDLSPHQLDIAYWLLGVPVSVSGYSLNQLKNYDAPDLVSLNAVFSNDILLQGTWAFNVPEPATHDLCEIIGTNGYIRFSFFRKSPIDVNGKIIEAPYPENIQKPMIAAVVRYFRGETGNPCSLEDALTTMKIIDSVTLN